MLECEFCETKFLSQEQFDSHSCREGTRMKELSTNLGMSAFRCYQQWFSARKFIAPQKRAFIASSLYNTFFKYVKFRRKMGIPDDKIYIGIMVEENILPQHWYSDDIYRYAMKKFDSDYPTKTYLRITLATLDRLKRIYNCNELHEVFDHLKPSDAIKLIQTRNLSPWVLLLSPRFKKYLQEETSKEERGLISNAMNLKHWKLMLELKKKEIPETRKYINELNL